MGEIKYSILENRKFKHVSEDEMLIHLGTLSDLQKTVLYGSTMMPPRVDNLPVGIFESEVN